MKTYTDGYRDALIDVQFAMEEFLIEFDDVANHINELLADLGTP